MFILNMDLRYHVNNQVSFILKKKWKCKTVAKSDAWTREWIQNMKCNMKGARLFGKFICIVIISMGIKNPTYCLVAVLQIEFCDKQTCQSLQYLEVALY